MNRYVKIMKKTLEIDSKRNKKYLSNKKIIDKLNDENITVYELPVIQYNKNVTRMSKESSNKRCKLFPLYDLNILVSFINGKTGNNSSFTIKWYEKNKQIEAGVLSVHILCNPDTEEVTFTTLYTIAIDGVMNKSAKVSKLDFTFDNHEIVKVGTNTTREESFKSVGYILLENICEFISKQQDGFTDTFESYFEQYSEITENEEINSFNIDNILNLLSNDNRINDDELLVTKYL